MRSEGAITAALAIDRIDRKILTCLQGEGRISNQALAQRVSLSPSACLARVRRLEAEGLILGYRAEVALERVRPTITLFAEVTLGQHSSIDFANFDHFVSLEAAIVESAQVSGPYDYLLKVMVSDILAWRTLSDQILNSNLGVGKISSHVLMKTTKPYKAPPL